MPKTRAVGDTRSRMDGKTVYLSVTLDLIHVNEPFGAAVKGVGALQIRRDVRYVYMT